MRRLWYVADVRSLLTNVPKVLEIGCEAPRNLGSGGAPLNIGILALSAD